MTFKKASNCTNLPTSPLTCPAFGNLLYDPCYAAPGYWAGCSSTNETNCVPQAPNTSWEGIAIYTNNTLYPKDNTTQANFRCPSGFFCPGYTNTTQCPDLCGAGFYCPTPKERIICPQGKYCPVGSTLPKNCPPLSIGCSEGSSIFNAAPAAVLGIVIAIIMSTALVIASIYFKRRLDKDTDLKLTGKGASSDVTSTGYIKDDTDINKQASLQTTAAAAVAAAVATTATTTATATATTIGSTSMLQRLKVESDQNISFTFTDMSLKLPNGGPTILKGVNGSIAAGKLTAIMGPSGAGKTTFLSVLSGKVDRTGGELYINGKKDEIYNYKRVVGFVPQEDIMHNDLTVFENIIHSADTRLPKSWTKQQRLDLVNYVIEVLGLSAIRNSVIGDENVRGISGGQRKRVNIGIELVSNPHVLFLDEPTSGLDSTSSGTVLKALKEFASRGVNVCTVLHQPKYEIYTLFDQILILGIGGKTVYMGTPQQAQQYFSNIGFDCPENTNPADFYMDIVAGMVPRRNDPEFKKSDLFYLWNEHCKRNTGDLTLNSNPNVTKFDDSNYKNDSFDDNDNRFLVTLKTPFIEIAGALRYTFQISDPSASKRETAGWFRQFWLFYKRRWLHRLHNPLPTVVFAAVSIIASAILGFTFSNKTIFMGTPVGLTTHKSIGFQLAAETYTTINIVVYLTLFLWVLVMLVATTHGVTLHGYTRLQFYREMSTGVCASAYYLAGILEVLPWTIVNALLYASIFYGLTDMQLGFGNMFLIVLPLYLGFYFVGVLASFFERENMNVIAIISGLILSIIFTGLTPRAGDIPTAAKWIWYLTFTFWTSQGFNTISYKQYENVYDIEAINTNKNTGDGFDINSYPLDIAMAFVTMFALVVFAGFLLKMVHYKKHR